MRIADVRAHVVSSLRRHPWLSVLAAGCLVASIPLAFYDRAISSWAVQQQGWLRTALDQPAVFGKGNVTFLAALALGAAGKRRVGIRILLALLILLPIIWPIKHVTGRTRPNGNDHAMPSGDAATAATLVAPLAGHPVGLAIGLGVTGVVASRRVLLEYHWPSDVAIGVAIGLVAGIVARGITLPSWRGLRRPWWVACLVVATAGMSLSYFEHWENIRQFALVLGPGFGVWIAAGWCKWACRQWPRWRARWAGFLGSWKLLVLSAGAVTAIYLLLASPASVWDRDEPRYTKATMEMIESGNWLVPTYDGEWRLHKPVGIYWLMAVSRLTVGAGEIAFRLPSVLATGACLLLTARIGRRLLGPAAAGGAVLVLASCTLMMIVGTLATTDAVLLALILAAMNGVVDELTGRRRWHGPIVLGLALAGTMLVKGPVGPAVVLSSAVLAGGLLRLAGTSAVTARTWARLAIALGVGTAGFLCWAIPADIVTEGGIGRVLIMEHIVQRSLQPREGHGGDFWVSLPYYLPVVLVGLFPWTGLLPAATSATLGGRLGGKTFRAMAIGWFVPMFVLMSLVATKLPHYILPVFPALALAAGGVLGRPDRLNARDRAWLARANLLLVPLALAGAAGLLASPIVLVVLANTHGLPDLPELANAGTSLGLVLLAMACLAWRLAPVRRLRLRAALWTTGIAAFCVSLLVLGLPVIERHKPSKHIARDIRQAVGPDVPVVTSGYDEDSLHFYLGQPTTPTLGPGAVAQWVQQPGPGVIIITAEHLREARERSGLPIRLPAVARRQGFQIAKGRWVRMVAFGRNLPDPASRPAVR